jgi:hypothetical protein
MSTNPDYEIGLWLDETSDAACSAWVVDINDPAEHNSAETLKAWRLDEYEEAYELAIVFAVELGLKEHRRVIEVDAEGNRECVFDPSERPIYDMAMMLTRHGERFIGLDAALEATYWLDHDFLAAEADPWCEIGVWDASTAAAFRDAMLTPDEVLSAAERLTEGLDDPIYSTCNADTPVDVIIAEVARARVN